MSTLMRWYFFALTVAAGAAAPAVSAEVIKIAQLEPATGNLAAAGGVLIKQMQAAVDLANGGKWADGDVTFEVTPFDNKGSPQESLAQLKLAIDHGYRFIAQGLGSGVALGLLDAIKKHNDRNPGKEVMLLNYYALDPDMTNSKCSFWHFRFESNSDMRVEALTTFMVKDMSIKKLYLINQNYDYGRQIQSAVKQYLNRKRPDIQIVGDDLHPIGTVKDFSPYVAKIKASGADTVFTGNWGNDFAFLAKAAKESSLNVVFYGVQPTGTGVATVMGPAGVGHVKTALSWHANNESFSGKNIVEAYKKKYNEDFTSIGPYNMLAVLGAAVKASKSTDPVKLAFAMEGIRAKGLNGEIEMRASDHQLQQPLYIAEWVKVNGKDTKYDLENTGFGWRTNQKLDAYVATQATSCQMKRPAK